MSKVLGTTFGARVHNLELSNDKNTFTPFFATAEDADQQNGRLRLAALHHVQSGNLLGDAWPPLGTAGSWRFERRLRMSAERQALSSELWQLSLMELNLPVDFEMFLFFLKGKSV